MATRHVIKFSAIMTFFCDENKMISRGENALESGHVIKMDFNPEIFILKGEVYASMKNKSYEVEIELDDNGEVAAAKCSCPKGIKCHHMAALLLFGHHNISITDQPCKWNVPRSSKQQKVLTCEDLYPRQPYKAVEAGVSEEALDKLRQKLQGINIGVAWLLKKEPEEELNLHIPMIEDVIFNQEYFNSSNKLSYIRSKLKLDEVTIRSVASQTTGQSENEAWLLLRKHRLTASNFGVVLSACRKNSYPPSLFKRLYDVYNLDGIRSIQWGKTNEKKAIEEFTQTTSLPVKATGLWLHSCGFLGASPDGLINEDAVIEVKCPYTYRNDILSEALKNNKNYIIYFNELNQLCVNDKHFYYDQIQGILHVVNRKICFLVIWSTKEIIITEIEKNEGWKKILII